MSLESIDTAAPSMVGEPSGVGTRRRISAENWVVALVLLDMLFIIAGGLAPTVIGYQFDQYPSPIIDGQLETIAFALFIYFMTTRVFHVYSTARIFHIRTGLTRLLASLAVTFAIILAVGAATKTSQTYSRIWFFSWFTLNFLVLPSSRGAAIAYLRGKRRQGFFAFKALSISIFGDPLGEADLGLEENQLVRIVRSMRLDGIDSISQLSDMIVQEEIDRVYVNVPWVDAPRVIEQLTELRQIAAEVYVLADDRRIKAHQLGISRRGERVSLTAVDRPINGWGLWLKRVQDIVAAGSLLLVFSPILLVVAIAIKLESRGPIIFRQKRVGFNGSMFELWKFRSMRVETTDLDASVQTSRGDPRVTAVGRIIRRTSLDELPQFFNVLQGSMSVVGPRPHALKTSAEGRPLEEVADFYAARHRVKPGLTGWAQINGYRGELDTIEKVQKRVSYDIEYIENWSTWLDIKIILRTVMLILYDPAAY